MTKRSFRQRLADLLDGSEHPRWVAWAVVLGLAAGFVCGWNLTLAVLLVVAALLNLHTRCFIACWAAGVVLAWWLDPVASRLGYVLLDGTPLGRAIGSLGNDPLVVLLGWDHYNWVGGFALSLLLGWPLSNAAARWIVRRRLVLAASLREEARVPDDPLDLLTLPVAPRLSFLERVAGRVLFGPMPDGDVRPAASGASTTPTGGGLARSESATDYDKTKQKQPTIDSPLAIGPQPPTADAANWTTARPIFRPLGWAIAVPLAASVALLVYGVGPVLLRQAVLEHLAAFNTATVDATRLDLSFWNGRFEIEGLRFADPADLNYDRLVVARATGTLDAGRLLRGRLKIEAIDVDGVYFHTPRDTPGQPVLDHITISQAADRVAVPPLELASDETPESTIAVEDQLESWPRLQTRLSLVEAALEQLHHLREWDASLSPARTHFALLAYPWKKRSSLEHDEPLVAVRSMRIEHISEPASLGPRGVLEVAHLNSRGDGPADGATRVSVVVPHVALELEATLHLAETEPVHTVRLRAYDLDLPSLIADAGKGNGYVQIGGGRIDLIGQGTFGRHGIDLPLKVDARQLVARVDQLDRLAGLRRETWNAGFARVRQLSGHVRLEGPWKAARLLFDPQAVVLQLKHQLRAAGEHRLVAAIEADLNDSRGGRAVAVAPSGDDVPAVQAPSTQRSDLSTEKRPTTSVAASQAAVSNRSDAQRSSERPNRARAGDLARRDSQNNPIGDAVLPSTSTATATGPAADNHSLKQDRGFSHRDGLADAAASSVEAGRAAAAGHAATGDAMAATDSNNQVPAARPGQTSAALPQAIDWQIGYDEGDRPIDPLSVPSRTPSPRARASQTAVAEASQPPAAKANETAALGSRQPDASRRQPAAGAASTESTDARPDRWGLAIGYEDRFAPRRAMPRSAGGGKRTTDPAMRVPIDRSAASGRSAAPLPERRSALAQGVDSHVPEPARSAPGAEFRSGVGQRGVVPPPTSRRSIAATGPWVWPKRAWRRIASVFSRNSTRSAPIAPPEPIGPPVPATPWVTVPPESVLPPVAQPRLATRPDPPAQPATRPSGVAPHERAEMSSGRSSQPSQSSRRPSSGQPSKWYERLWR